MRTLAVLLLLSFVPALVAAAPHTPFPADGTVDVPLDVVLTWQAGFLTPCNS